jgi:hypothetical protein
MLHKRYRAPFWRRRKPSCQHDITKLRPHDLRRGSRFETMEDVEIESERSELVLGQGRRVGRALSLSLRRCREQHHRCDETFCPLCARVFRRWFIGELLRLVGSEADATLRNLRIRSNERLTPWLIAISCRIASILA